MPGQTAVHSGCPNPTPFLSAMSSLPDYNALPLPQQVAQMVVVRASGYLFDHQIQYPAWEPPHAVLRRWVEDLGVGGVIFLGGSAAELGVRSQQIQSWADIPLLMAADIEEGVGQRFAGATWFPPPMALAEIARRNPEEAIALAEAMGSITAQEALAIGINWVLGPVCDVNNNPRNPVINVRAFGETPDIVSDLITAFLRGAQPHPALTCAKHFPGHGDTETDSHLDLPLIPHSRQRLSSLELLPFKAAIAASVDAIMSAHLLIPALDQQFPATLSPPILTGELRQRLGFEGLIVTDALVMGAIANRYGTEAAAVQAIEAGADILLMPLDPEAAIAAVCRAVESGQIGRDRITASLERIGRAKQKLLPVQGDTSHAWETLPPPPIQLEQIAQPRAIATAQQILHASQRLSLPAQLPARPPGRNLIVLDDLLQCDFLTASSPAIALPQQQGYSLQRCDRYNSAPPAGESLPTLLQVFIRGNPFRGSAELTQVAQDWLDWLLQTGQLQALVVYGSPYALERFLPQLPAQVPSVFTYGQMPQAQAIALQTLFAQFPKA